MVTSNETKERIGIKNGFSLGKCIVCNASTRNKYCSNRCKSKHFRNEKRGGTIPSHPKELSSADFDKIELKDFMTPIELAKIRACMFTRERCFYDEKFDDDFRTYTQNELPFEIVIKLWNILCREENKEQYNPTDKAECSFQQLVAYQLYALHKLFNFDNEMILKL